MTRDDNWSAEWASKKLISHDDIVAASAQGGNHVLDVRELPRPVTIATISKAEVSASDLAAVCTSAGVEFVLNIKKDAFYDRSALEFSDQNGIGVGGVGDLYRATNDRVYRTYREPEVEFILRGLRQHRRVTAVVRQNNRAYHIERKSPLSALTILALNEYDMTADAVRSGVDRYGPADVILASNPNCKLTAQCVDAAESCGLRIIKWGELMQELNH